MLDIYYIYIISQFPHNVLPFFPQDLCPRHRYQINFKYLFLSERGIYFYGHRKHSVLN